MQIKGTSKEQLLNLLSKYKRNRKPRNRHLYLSNEDFSIIMHILSKSCDFEMLSSAGKILIYGNYGQPEDHFPEIYKSLAPLVCSDFSKLTEKESEKILEPLMISISESLRIDLWISIYQELANRKPTYWLYSGIWILEELIGLKTVFDYEDADLFPKSECGKIFFSPDTSDLYRRKSWWAIFSGALDLPELFETSWMTFDPAFMEDPIYVRQIEAMILTDEETEIEIQKLLQIKKLPLFMPLKKNGEPKYRRIPEDLQELLETSPPQRRTIVKE